MKHSKRKAREERLLGEFQALEDFANLGDTPDDVQKYRTNNPGFFPNEKTEWIYRNAEFWRTFSKWRREDPDGSCLRHLLGFDADRIPFPGEEDTELEPLSLFMWKEHPEKMPHPVTINGLTFEIRPKEIDTIAGLPYGTPVVDGNTGIISWEFGCQFQRAVYDLMQDRWRAKVCPECGKYFIADKTGQKYCSTKCTGERKRKEASAYHHRKGKFARQAKALRAKSLKRRS